ncbi:MAG: M20/M25/M40 family metallo-hydrolase [Clostridia bacterium]|nr:M20/M25/M40 family metallo-hydrolase [Clostridia bacterium]
MNLQSIIDKKYDAAKYMVKEITHICKNLPKRDPGSEGEKLACEYMADVLKNDCGCDRVTVESFKENPGSFYGWIYLTVCCGFVAIPCLFFAPIASFIFLGIGLAIALLQFGTYKKAVDKLFPEKTGHNVTALKKPTGEVKRRIIFNGHPDATWEWPMNYHFGYLGFDLHIISSFLGLFYFIGLAIAAIAQNGAIGAMDMTSLLSKFALGGLVFVPLWIGMFKMWDKKTIVDGANDNLSGCYMGIALLKYLKDEGIEFENTEIGVVLTGSEEAGLRGAKAWAEAHKGEFDDVPTFIYAYDTIHDPKFLAANYRDLNATVKADKDACDLFMEAAAELGIHCEKGLVPPFGGATDSAAFAQAGFRAAGITGLNHKIEPYYHTRRDSYDNMNEEGLAGCFAVTVKTLEMFDNGAKQ